MNSIKRMFSYADKRKGLLWGSIVFASLSVSLGILAYIMAHRTIMLFNGNKLPELKIVIANVGLITIILLLKTFLLFEALKLSHINAYTILGELRKAITSKLMRLPMGDIKKRTAGNLKMHIIDDVESMELVLAHIIPEGIANILTPIATIVLIFIIDWRMALLTFTIIPIGLVPFMMMFREYKPRMEKYTRANSHMNSTIVEYISGMKEIKAFNQTTQSYEKYTDSVSGFRKQVVDWAFHTSKYTTAYVTLLPASILFVLPFGGLFYLNGSLSISDYVMCIILALGFAEPLLRLTNFFDNIALLTVKEKAIHQLLNEKEIEFVDDGITDIEDYCISFDNVTFAYEKEDVLKDISFTCKPNTVTALVGPSGSGKSTIAKLIARFWDVDGGSIKLGGVNISNIEFESLMDSISYVSQDSYLFDTTIMENIRMGRVDASDEEVIKAAKNAMCDEFIAKTEKGYYTNAGEAGDKFSGGQKQRLSIARALLKDAPVVILDEATAFSDPENEDKIQLSLNQLLRGKTVIVIAHRLSTIVNADNIIVVNKGKILNQGTHEDLLKYCQKYNDMWRIHQEAMEWDFRAEEERSHV
ncbi:ABC transporter ATP-binding protein [Clostridiaceae bacterium M8S5]|nr:ABC transporter ATP-binding protein [Clostridiaceae bacterium M8S5]